MLTHHRVGYLLTLAATLLLVIGTFTYQRIGRPAERAGAGQPRNTDAMSRRVVVASSALAMLSVLFAGLQMRAESRRRQLVELQLHRALASVEEQVTERTTALSKAMAELTLSEQQFRGITAQLHLALDERAEALARAEEARRVAEQASSLKDEFLATASHELRTPLNAIVGWAHVLQSVALVNDEQRVHAVAAIARNAKIQTRLIEDLLDVSRMIHGRVSLAVVALDARVAVNAAIETLRPNAATKDLSVEVLSPSEPVPVMADPERLQQVVWHLLSNAIEAYTPRGGAITVGVQTVGDRVEISIADTGEGIVPSFLPHAFEPFRQGASATMRSGMGLGLAIVRQLVNLHGGSVTASSAGAGKGAVFSVSLPLAPTLTKPSLPEPTFERPRVLVAERPRRVGGSGDRDPAAPGV